jgi:hypothetical protein
VQRRRTQLPSLLRIWETRELRPPGTAIRNKRRNELTTRHVCVSSPCKLTTASTRLPSCQTSICSHRLVSRAAAKALPVSKSRGGPICVTKSGSPERRRSGACFEAVHPFVTALRSDLVSAGPRGALSLSGLNRAFKAPGKPASQRANFEYANRPDHQAREDSTGASARRGAAWSMWPKEGWPAQHGARERRGVSLVGATTGVHRAPGGRGYTRGAKKAPPNCWPWIMDQWM